MIPRWRLFQSMALHVGAMRGNCPDNTTQEHTNMDYRHAIEHKTADCPEGWADVARAAEADEEYTLAARAWFYAKGASTGHKRRERYDNAIARCELMADAQQSMRDLDRLLGGK